MLRWRFVMCLRTPFCGTLLDGMRFLKGYLLWFQTRSCQIMASVIYFLGRILVPVSLRLLMGIPTLLLWRYYSCLTITTIIIIFKKSQCVVGSCFKNNHKNISKLFVKRKKFRAINYFRRKTFECFFIKPKL